MNCCTVDLFLSQKKKNYIHSRDTKINGKKFWKHVAHAYFISMGIPIFLDNVLFSAKILFLKIPGL